MVRGPAPGFLAGLAATSAILAGARSRPGVTPMRRGNGRPSGPPARRIGHSWRLLIRRQEAEPDSAAELFCAYMPLYDADEGMVRVSRHSSPIPTQWGTTQARSASEGRRCAERAAPIPGPAVGGGGAASGPTQPSPLALRASAPRSAVGTSEECPQSRRIRRIASENRTEKSPPPEASRARASEGRWLPGSSGRRSVRWASCSGGSSGDGPRSRGRGRCSAPGGPGSSRHQAHTNSTTTKNR
jgi:hypothetical protein